MTRRTRKALGTMVLVLFIALYALIAMEIGAARIAGASALVQAVYFAVAGLAWILPAGLLIRWMQRPDRPSGDRR